MILKRAMKGELNLMEPAMKVMQELMSIPDFNEEEETLFSKQKKYISNFKKAVLMTAGGAAQKLMMDLGKEQEILMNISDMAIDTYLAESLQLRVEKLVSIKGEEACKPQLDMMRVFITDAADRMNKNGKEAINGFAQGDEQRMMLLGLKRFTKTEPFNTKDARRNVAAVLVDANKYCF
jgi:chitinase